VTGKLTLQASDRKLWHGLE